MDEKRFNPRRCRWVRREMYGLRQRGAFLCKEMEDPPKDSKNVSDLAAYHNDRIKKESPNEGTETLSSTVTLMPYLASIKKESPNEGTETDIIQRLVYQLGQEDKKRIPE